MKLSVAIITASLAVSQAFMVAPSGNVKTTQLNAASMDRRELISGAAALATGAAFLTPEIALAADYVPRLEDMKQIYFLGASLDKLIAKLENPDTVELALEGVRMFNRDPDFYPGYAKNFIGKTVKKSADSDPRVGYVKQACALISSVETVAAGSAFEAGSADEAIKRVKKAQALIGKFLADCGVKEEKFDAFIAAHPSP